MADKIINGSLEVNGPIIRNNTDISQNLSKVTYSELKALRDSGQLIQGRFYRITDYSCVISSSNTRSADNVFDIIVVADSTNKLNEEARAVLHDGDTYFANSNLSAWKLWYCLDNDTNRFEWAVNVSRARGVIYRMIDEFGNDCPYDFKNIQFTKNGVYTRAYTFSYTEEGVIKDASLRGYGIDNNVICHSNVIKPLVSSKKQYLNFNVFYSENNTTAQYYSNIIEFGCFNNTFISMLIRSHLYQYCGGNKIDSGRCITLMSECANITLGHVCFYITIGQRCEHITFESQCYYIVIDNGCRYLNITSSTAGAYNNLLKNIHIHLGVTGTSILDPLTITVDRNLNYETNIVPQGTTTIEV